MSPYIDRWADTVTDIDLWVPQSIIDWFNQLHNLIYHKKPSNSFKRNIISQHNSGNNIK